MKLLFYADLHIGKYKEFDTNNSRLYRCLTAFETIIDFAVKNNCSAIIDAGDLLDQKNNIDLITYIPFYNTVTNNLKNNKIKHYSLVGNHNMADDTNPKINNLVPVSNYITIIDSPGIITTFGNITIFGMPYYRNLNNWENVFNDICKYAYELKQNKHTTIFIGHQEIRGAMTGTHRYVAGEGVHQKSINDNPFDWLIFGHYHKHQWLNNKTMYLGAVLQQEFGEEGNPQGFWTYDTELNKWDYIPLHPKFGVFTTITNKQQLPWVDTNKNNFYRIKINEELAEEEKIYILKNNTRYEPPISIKHGNTRLNIEHFKSMHTLINAYINTKVNDPEERKHLIDLVQYL